MEGNLSTGTQKSPKITYQKKQKLEGEFELGRAGGGGGRLGANHQGAQLHPLCQVFVFVFSLNNGFSHTLHNYHSTLQG